MHELSLAMSIVDIAREEGERLGGRISIVHLRVGALVGIVRDALQTSYQVACLDTELEGSELVIEEVKVVAFCATCQAERELTSIQWIGCPECGTPTPEISRGRELELVALEIEE